MQHRPTCFGYIRVSTNDQDTTPEVQRDYIMSHYEETLKDKYELGEIFFDQGVSAWKVDFRQRPEGSKLHSLASMGDMIVFPKFDRAFRCEGDKKITEKQWVQRQIDWKYLDINFDTTTAIGTAIVGFIAIMANLESGLKSERQVDSYKGKRKEKRAMKSAPPPGWFYNRMTGQLEEDYAERQAMFEWFQWNDMRVQSIKKTCKWLRENNVKRKSGHWYRDDWLYQARPYMLSGFPCEGYVRQAWKDHGDEMRQAKQQRVKKGQRISVQLLRERIQLLKQLPPDQVEAYVNGELD
jgi:DNA invertase Pin-like site-specific DNA recombinase